MLRFNNQKRKYFSLPLNWFVLYVNHIFWYFLCYKNNILGNTECSQYNILNEADRGISSGKGHECDREPNNGWKGASWYRYKLTIKC